MSESVSATVPARKSLLRRIQGEWSWEKYIPATLGIACIIDALLNAEGIRALARDAELQTGLILIVGAYLSELRYRLLKDVRND